MSNYSKIRTTNIHFPKILLHPDEKVRFVRILEEDESTIQRILSDVLNDRERKYHFKIMDGLSLCI